MNLRGQGFIEFRLISICNLNYFPRAFRNWLYIGSSFHFKAFHLRNIFILRLCNLWAISSRTSLLVSNRYTLPIHLLLYQLSCFFPQSIVTWTGWNIEKSLDFLPSMLLWIEQEYIILLYPWKFIKSLLRYKFWDFVVFWIEYYHKQTN